MYSCLVWWKASSLRKRRLNCKLVHGQLWMLLWTTHAITCVHMLSQRVQNLLTGSKAVSQPCQLQPHHTKYILQRCGPKALTRMCISCFCLPAWLRCKL